MFPDTWIIKRSIPMPETNSTWGWKKQPTVTIYPIGDLHLGSIGCHEKEWGEFVNFIKDEPDSYVVVVGDIMDNGTRNSILLPLQTKIKFDIIKNLCYLRVRAFI